MKNINMILLIVAIALLIGILLFDYLRPNGAFQPFVYLPLIITIWLLLRGQAKKMDERKHQKENKRCHQANK